MPEVNYVIRPMKDEDIPQVAQIDREAFSSEWMFRSQASYKQDLNNPAACYVVASMKKGVIPKLAGQDVQKAPWFKRLFSYNHYPNTAEYIIGFAGFWLMLKEAHVTVIAVRNNYRRVGIGEGLFISVIELARQLNADVVTLEVRVSNETAQALYKKYGFQVVGSRPRYYSDNGEDAVLMTTDIITSVSFQAHFQQLRKSHSQKWGQVLSIAQLT
jgi:ribosomal-protein-alanine N-acetyltransferase